MIRIRRSSFAVLLIGMTALLLAGCGPSLVKVKGRLTKNGEPIRPGKHEALELAFCPYVDDGSFPDDMLTGRVYDDGTFVVLGKRRKGIPKGKYRVSVELLSTRSNKDKWKGQFGPIASPIIREVTGKEIQIDLDKPEAD